MEIAAILTFVTKWTGYANAALQLGRDVAPYLLAIKTALAGDTTQNQMDELDKQCAASFAKVEALPDDPE